MNASTGGDQWMLWVAGLCFAAAGVSIWVQRKLDARERAGWFRALAAANAQHGTRFPVDAEGLAGEVILGQFRDARCMMLDPHRRKVAFLEPDGLRVIDCSQVSHFRREGLAIAFYGEDGARPIARMYPGRQDAGEWLVRLQELFPEVQ